MNFLEEWRQIALSAMRHRTRTLLTAFGVFWGIFMVVLLLGIGKGLERGVYQMFKDDAVNSVWLLARQTSMPYQGFNVGRSISFTLDDIEAIKKAIPGLNWFTPRHQVNLVQPITAKGEQGSFPVFGIYPGYLSIEKSELLDGRFLNDLDIKKRRRVVVIGQRVAERLFGDVKASVGKAIAIEGISFQVVGVFYDSGGEQELQRIYLPYTSLSRSIDNSQSFAWIAFVTEQAYSGEWLELELRKLMAQRHNFDPQDLAAISVFNANEQFKKIQALFVGITVFITIVGLGTLFAGLVSVSNIMMISVKERRREIGLRKAIGATPLSIQMLILKEALLISSVAGYLGLVAGVALIEGLRSLNIRAEFFADPEVNLGVALSALVCIILGGGLAGYVPARQAALISPIEALRNE